MCFLHDLTKYRIELYNFTLQENVTAHCSLHGIGDGRIQVNYQIAIQYNRNLNRIYDLIQTLHE